MKKLFTFILLLILFTTSIFAQETETICVYDIVYPEFWESTSTITKESYGHYETYFIDDKIQYETRDGLTRMIYHFYEHPTYNHIFFYGGYVGTTSSTRLYCYDNPLSNEDVILESIYVYPNPVDNILNISGLTEFEIKVYDILGRELLYFSSETIIDLSSLPTGIYFVKIFNTINNQIISKKILKK